jgi:hypothetical protein
MSRNPFLPKFSDLPQELPIFPLAGAVVMPGVQLPLNIFEPRYLRMIGDALKTHHLIGMLQPRPDNSSDDAPEIHAVAPGALPVQRDQRRAHRPDPHRGLPPGGRRVDGRHGYRRRAGWSASRSTSTPKR